MRVATDNHLYPIEASFCCQYKDPVDTVVVEGTGRECNHGFISTMGHQSNPKAILNDRILAHGLRTASFASLRIELIGASLQFRSDLLKSRAGTSLQSILMVRSLWPRLD